MGMTIGANVLAALLFVFAAGEESHIQDAWSTDDLRKASCEITWAYYNNNESMIDELIEKYGDPAQFDKDRLDLIHLEMTLRKGDTNSTRDFKCDAETIDKGMIIVRGTLTQERLSGASHVAMNWEFVVDDSGHFYRIIIDEAVMDYSKPGKAKVDA
ncbi:hypothetical protein MNBD_NITROSPINAE02-218 [hydrothermal vent metagenome]|uniref:Uncharacterized protein n=1 Tax=hydrothermal vent metagenome TaxID=652676 RepID=A0A3B1C2R6_9ZZZZ